MGYIYLYGMVLTTQHIRTRWAYPKPDTYCEVEEKYYGIGGETGTAAVILNALGCRVKLAGSHLGYRNDGLVRFFVTATASATNRHRLRKKSRFFPDCTRHKAAVKM
jgi:hypothetical protein